MPLLQEIRAGNNGGFPQPPPGEPYRVVRCSHPVCGTETRVRLPQALPERAIHRVVCDGCKEPFPAAASLAGLIGNSAFGSNGTAAPALASPAAATAAAKARPARPFGFSNGNAAATAPAPAAGSNGRGPLALAGSRLRAPSLPSPSGLPSSSLWRWASIPVALVAVIGGLTLIQGDSGNPSPAAIEASNAGTAEAAGQAKFISRPGYSLALPDGWSKADPPEGAVFAAQSDDGLADATLWIEQDEKLSFEEFEQRSLSQLAEIGSNPRVIDRVEGPTVESTIVQLQADTADGAAPYRVTLRAAGPYRLYFATAIQPGAPAKLRGDTELMHGSLRPEVELAGVETGSEASP